MKRIISYLVMIIVIFSLISCGQVVDTPNPGNGDIDNPIVTPGGTNPDKPTPPPSTEKVTFKVSLVYNKKTYVPGKGEKIQVVWSDDYTQYTETISSDGYAVKQLDGDFNVYLVSAPEGYSYNPNIYTADNDNPEVVIELYKISRISKGQGTGIYKEFQMSTTGVYRCEIKKALQKVYYEFSPNKSGYYVLETIVNIYEDAVNPKVDIYQGSSQWKPSTPNQSGLDTGGANLKNGFTKNVRWVVKLTDEMIGNVYTFAIYADSKSGVYPINVDFSISYEGEHYVEQTVSKLMVAEEIHSFYRCVDCDKHYYDLNNIPNNCTECNGNNLLTVSVPYYDSSNYNFINSDGGIGSYYNSTTNGSGLLIGNNFRFNEESGFWHVYNNQTGEFGPILCAKITKPCAYYEESLNLIESHGNNNLTVSNGTENYKMFVEQQYAAVCNADGVCFVTNELKEFLQKFSVSQRLFFDGNGFVESTGVYASEENQWLFACGYYEVK